MTAEECYMYEQSIFHIAPDSSRQTALRSLQKVVKVHDQFWFRAAGRGFSQRSYVSTRFAWKSSLRNRSVVNAPVVAKRSPLLTLSCSVEPIAISGLDLARAHRQRPANDQAWTQLLLAGVYAAERNILLDSVSKYRFWSRNHTDRLPWWVASSHWTLVTDMRKEVQLSSSIFDDGIVRCVAGSDSSCFGASLDQARRHCRAGHRQKWRWKETKRFNLSRRILLKYLSENIINIIMLSLSNRTRLSHYHAYSTCIIVLVRGGTFYGVGSMRIFIDIWKTS